MGIKCPSRDWTVWNPGTSCDRWYDVVIHLEWQVHINCVNSNKHWENICLCRTYGGWDNLLTDLQSNVVSTLQNSLEVNGVWGQSMIINSPRFCQLLGKLLYGNGGNGFTLAALIIGGWVCSEDATRQRWKQQLLFCCSVGKMLSHCDDTHSWQKEWLHQSFSIATSD